MLVILNMRLQNQATFLLERRYQKNKTLDNFFEKEGMMVPIKQQKNT
jgi:hypothetical protein